ncbi:MAG: WD40 repeat domain-containing protein [Acidimicrobiaceae bacterium]|nr:WD40 repeat domain-containing protein [Acidimicrobiaceae bacterium]
MYGLIKWGLPVAAIAALAALATAVVVPASRQALWAVSHVAAKDRSASGASSTTISAGTGTGVAGQQSPAPSPGTTLSQPAAAATPAPTPSVAPPAALPTRTISKVASSPSGDRVYVATGGDSILVLDATGKLIGQVPGLGYTNWVATGPDGTVWVPLPNVPAIAEVDPISLSVVARFPVPSAYCPGTVAVTGPFVVFGFNCPFYANPSLGTGIDGGVGVLDSRSGQVTILTQLRPSAQVVVATSPGLPGKALAIDWGSHPTALTVYDVSSGTAVWQQSLPMDVAAVVDMAISPDGSTVALADLYQQVINTYSTSDLSPGVSYQLGANARSVAWSLDGGTLAATGSFYPSLDVGAVFTPGDPTPRARVAVPDDGVPRIPAEEGLVVSADGTRMITGTLGATADGIYMDVLGTRPAALSLSGPSSAVVGQPLTFSATLSLDGVPAPAGTALTVNRSGPTGSAALGTVLVGDGGTATFVDTAPYPGATTWSVRWGGDTTYVYADAQLTGQIDKAPTSLTIAFTAGKQQGKRLNGTVVVTLGPTVSSRFVTVTATNSLGNTELFQGQLPATGVLSIPYTVTQTTTLTANYNGATLNYDATASTTVSFGT